MTNTVFTYLLDFSSRNISMDLDAEVMPPVPTHRPFLSPTMAPVSTHQPVSVLLPSTPTHKPVLLPPAPTHQPVLLPTAPNHRPDALPQSPYHSLKALSQEQRKAGKMIISALHRKRNSKPTVLKAVSGTVKSKHQKGPSPSKKKPQSISPSTHQVHRTTGPVTLNSPTSQTTSGNPNDGQIVELPRENEELALLMNGMYSREKKRRPRTQECGDQENPEFTRHQKLQLEEAAEGEAAYNDDEI